MTRHVSAMLGKLRAVTASSALQLSQDQAHVHSLTWDEEICLSEQWRWLVMASVNLEIQRQFHREDKQLWKLELKCIFSWLPPTAWLIGLLCSKLLCCNSSFFFCSSLMLKYSKLQGNKLAFLPLRVDNEVTYFMHTFNSQVFDNTYFAETFTWIMWTKSHFLDFFSAFIRLSYS